MSLIYEEKEQWFPTCYLYRTAGEKAEAVRRRDSETTKAVGQADGAWYCPYSLEAIGRKAFAVAMGEGEA